MEQIKKFIDFLGISYPRHIYEERYSFQKSNYLIPKEITKWWAMGLQDFVKYVHSADHGEGMFAYVKSCQYTEHVIERIDKENQELKSLIYEMLDEINELKEHNNCLSERILYLENKPLIIY
jgi:hemerythrin-like domain-containing protein